jgi:hypothetical protein
MHRFVSNFLYIFIGIWFALGPNLVFEVLSMLPVTYGNYYLPVITGKVIFKITGKLLPFKKIYLCRGRGLGYTKIFSRPREGITHGYSTYADNLQHFFFFHTFSSFFSSSPRRLAEQSRKIKMFSAR